MAYYEEIDNILNTTISMVLENQNICKMLYYYPKEVNFRYNPLEQPNIKDTSSLLMKNIFPLPKEPDVELNQTCLLNICVHGGNNLNKNKGYRSVLIIFDIMCHLDSWIIKNSFRPIKIMSEIDAMFNNIAQNMPIINKPISQPFKARQYTNKFYGFQLAYEVIVNSNVRCE